MSEVAPSKSGSKTSPLTKGKSHVQKVLIDRMGQDEEAPGTDQIKRPRGITDYSLSGHPPEIWEVSNISTKLGPEE